MIILNQLKKLKHLKDRLIVLQRGEKKTLIQFLIRGMGCVSYLKKDKNHTFHKKTHDVLTIAKFLCTYIIYIYTIMHVYNV